MKYSIVELDERDGDKFLLNTASLNPLIKCEEKEM